mgnify:FL=1
MRQHPTGQVIAEAMNHITILAWTGGKEKRMEYKFLNEKYRIVAAGIPRKTPGVSIYYNHADVIFINDDAIGLGKLVELFATYLDLDNLERLEARNYVQKDGIKSMLCTLDRIDRIRRRLYKRRSA